MDKIVSSILAIYIAAFLYTNIPFVKSLMLDGVAGEALFWNHVAIFVLFFALAFLALSRNISAYIGRGATGNLKMILAAIALVGVIISIFYHIIPLTPIYDLPPYIDRFFASDLSFTLWLLAALAILFI
ncbi:MAG: hypothetical protein WD874_00570 [Parcubacteria group bacterium]